MYHPIRVKKFHFHALDSHYEPELAMGIERLSKTNFGLENKPCLGTRINDIHIRIFHQKAEPQWFYQLSTTPQQDPWFLFRFLFLKIPFPQISIYQNQLTCEWNIADVAQQQFSIRNGRYLITNKEFSFRKTGLQWRNHVLWPTSINEPSISQQ